MKEIVIKIHDIPQNDHERWALKNGTPLPKNPTNGDMIKALYPGVKLFTNGAEIGFRPKGQPWAIWCHTDWWDAPYEPFKEAVKSDRC